MIGLVLQVPEWGNATILEIAWTLIGAGTLIMVAWNFAGARTALALPSDLVDEYEEQAARVIRLGYLRREAFRFAIAFLILATGITGDYVAPVIHPSVVTLTGLVLTAAFFLMGLLTTLQSFLDGRDRHAVRDLLMQSHRFHADEDWLATRRDVGDA